MLACALRSSSSQKSHFVAIFGSPFSATLFGNALPLAGKVNARHFKYVCQNCRAEENLRCPEHSEGNGVVLKFAANRSRQLGEVCARLRFWHAKKYAPTVASAILAFCRKFVKHLKQCFFKGCPERAIRARKTVLCPAKKRYGRAETSARPPCYAFCSATIRRVTAAKVRLRCRTLRAFPR